MNRNRLFVLTTATAVVLCGVVAGGAKTQSGGMPHAGPSMPGPQAGDKKAEEQFKNIQVLKGVPADQIFPTMQFITASLGVECEF